MLSDRDAEKVFKLFEEKLAELDAEYGHPFSELNFRIYDFNPCKRLVEEYFFSIDYHNATETYLKDIQCLTCDHARYHTTPDEAVRSIVLKKFKEDIELIVDAYFAAFERFDELSTLA